MPNNILIVGGVAGGASAAAKARRTNESANITIFEKGPYVCLAVRIFLQHGFTNVFNLTVGFLSSPE